MEHGDALHSGVGLRERGLDRRQLLRANKLHVKHAVHAGVNVGNITSALEPAHEGRWLHTPADLPTYLPTYLLTYLLTYLHVKESDRIRLRSCPLHMRELPSIHIVQPEGVACEHDVLLAKRVAAAEGPAAASKIRKR